MKKTIQEIEQQSYGEKSFPLEINQELTSLIKQTEDYGQIVVVFTLKENIK